MEDMSAGRRVDFVLLRVHIVVADGTEQIHDGKSDGYGDVIEDKAAINAEINRV